MISNSIKNNRILRDKFNETSARDTLKITKCHQRLKENLKKKNGKTSHSHGLEDFVLLRVQTLESDLQSQFNSYKNPSWLLFKYNELILKFIWKFKGPRIAKT